MDSDAVALPSLTFILANISKQKRQQYFQCHRRRMRSLKAESAALAPSPMAMAICL